MKVPRVSICIPAYRQGELLRTLLVSVLVQDFTDYEIIVSDDSPGNEVSDVIDDMELGDTVRYFRNERALGSPANWNSAISHARGGYIKIMHHDDRFAGPGALRRFVEVLDANPQAVLAFCASNNCRVDGGGLWVHRPDAERLGLVWAHPERLFLGNIIGAPSAIIYRNTVEARFDERMKWLVDIDFYCRVLAGNGNRPGIYIDEPLVDIVAGAEGQITQSCRYEPSVELRESFLMFGKIVAAGLDAPALDAAWFSLFERYGITMMADISRFRDLYQPFEQRLVLLLRRANRRAALRLPFYVYHFLLRKFVYRRGL